MELSSENDFLIAFGTNLKKVRRANGFTQEQLANDIGIEISQISRIERGVISTSISNVFKISRVLQVDIQDLFSF
ncbi:helix-turn-helix domain-containing protein [Mesonia mobilis]|uniref:HTH cro/C1-type domain-containing protein n=1 Tax=Mesonia mobilis TaxID=369791 RepID=A0ABQ3BSQ9_9FLAO|nr:helix-turn-helix transcriptional regulator [Aquimarina celericrescens]GGZ56386.1 hypothetical protein GCM10008088_17450 [Mesonia mobilis]